MIYKISNSIIEAVRSIRPLLVVFIGLYPSVIFLKVDGGLVEFCERVSSAALIIQIGICASAFFGKALEEVPLTVGEKYQYSIKRGISALSIFAKIIIWSMASIMLLESLNVNVTPLLAGLGVGSIALGLARQQMQVSHAPVMK